MKTLLSTIAALTCTFAPGSEWTDRTIKDGFTDEDIRAASVKYATPDDQVFALYVNCFNDNSLNVGLFGSHTDLIDEGDADDQFEIPVRFDDAEPETNHFIRQGSTLFLVLNPSPLWRGLIQELGVPVEEAQMQIRQLFIKGLADGSRLRMKIPQVDGPTVLDFPLAGAKRALSAIFQDCRTPAAEGDLFLNSDGKPYVSLVDVLMDETWRTRYEASMQNLEEPASSAP